MNKLIVINAEHGGSDIGTKGTEILEKDYTLKISKYINDEIKKEGIKTYLVRDRDEYLSNEERIDLIEEETPDNSNTIVITNSIGKTYGGAEIIYSLKDTSRLANFIATEFEAIGVRVNKYYQRRLPSNPTKDYNEMIRELGSRESIIIEYGDLSYDEDLIRNNYEELGQAVVNGLNKYLGIIDVYYDVKKGDNLYSIAQKFNINVNELKNINNLSSNILSVGQQLIIPEKKENNVNDIDNYYIVVAGDTLYSIARKNRTTVDEIKRINKLSNNLLSLGQKLIIPKQTNIYIVRKGDSLYSISRKYGISVNELMTLNNLNSTLLSIGQELIIK